MECVKEWIIIPSTLDEVFRVVVDTNRQVVSANDRVAAEATAVQRIHMCSVCHKQRTQKGGSRSRPEGCAVTRNVDFKPSHHCLVTVHNAAGRAYEIDGVFCPDCIAHGYRSEAEFQAAEAREEQEAKAAAAAAANAEGATPSSTDDDDLTVDKELRTPTAADATPVDATPVGADAPTTPTTPKKVRDPGGERCLRGQPPSRTIMCSRCHASIVCSRS